MNLKFLILLFVFIFSIAFSQEQNYIPFRKGNLWGLCDSSKRIIVQPQYYSISGFDGSVGGFHAEQNGRFGIIDKNANYIMPFISEHEPIKSEGGNFIVYDGFDYYEYSKSTKQKIKKHIPTANREINDVGFASKNTPFVSKENLLDSSDKAILEEYDKEGNHLNYQDHFVEIYAQEKRLGIYVPQAKKIFFDTSEIIYEGAEIYNNRVFVVVTDFAYQVFGLIDENSNVIFPTIYSSIELDDYRKLIILSEQNENDPYNPIYKTILPNQKILDGYFDYEKEIVKNGQPYQLFYKLVNGKKNYAGEDGTLYFEG